MAKIIHGIDLTNINRNEFKNKSLIKRVLHPFELNTYLSFEADKQKMYIAKMWAIKEALFKAYNFKYGFNKIEILKLDNQLYAIIDNIRFSISVSYCDELVIASVMAIVN